MLGPSPKQLQYLNFSITTCCLIGFSLSLYSFLVELNLENDPTYKALCDINERVSCTKAFGSKYGKGFGIIGKVLGENSTLNLPNSLYGMVFYTLYFFCNMGNGRIAIHVNIFLALMSFMASMYLAFVLVFFLKDFCVICVSIYLVSAALVVLSVYKKYIFEKNDKVSEKSSHAKQS